MLTNTMILIIAAAFGIASFVCGITIIRDINRTIRILEKFQDKNI